MTGWRKRQVVDMAREAGLFTHKEVQPEIERFAELVRADERERIKQVNAPEIERINAHIKELEDAVLAERKACYELTDSRCQCGGLIQSRGQA